MSELTQATASIRLREHDIHAFYRLPAVDLERGPGIRLADLTCDHSGKDCVDVLPEDQRAALAGRYTEEAVWERPAATADGSGLHVSLDLAPAIRELLSGRRPELATHWRLSARAREFLNSAELYPQDTAAADRTAKRIALEFNEAACTRLRAAGIEPATLLVRIEDLTLTAFATGTAFALARLAFERPDRAPLSANELAEAVAAISRFNRCYWVDAASHTPVPGPTFSLGALLRALAKGKAPRDILARRVPTHAFAGTASRLDPEDQEILAAFLARRYTTAYDLDIAQSDIAHLRDFANIRHAISVEGAATVIAPNAAGQLPDFLQDWQKSVGRACYVPLMLLALHEDGFLGAGRARAIASDADKPAIDAFEAMVDDALMFRLGYRFAHVSDIAMHNAFGDALRQALRLDRRLDEMEDDVQATAERLAAAGRSRERQNHDAEHRRYYALSVLGSAAIAALTAQTLSKEFFPLLWPDESLKSQTGWSALAVGAGIAAIVLIVGYLRRPQPTATAKPDRTTTHAMIRAMRERARED